MESVVVDVGGNRLTTPYCPILPELLITHCRLGHKGLPCTVGQRFKCTMGGTFLEQLTVKRSSKNALENDYNTDLK